MLPKTMGGMGFRDMRAFNQALLAKQPWRLLDSLDSLCARLLRAKYYPRSNLLDTVFSSSSSAVWKGIVHGLELLKKGIIWRVGDGTLIKTWRDAWIPRGHNFRPVTPKRNCQFNWVADFLNEHGAWNVQRLREHFWELDVREILKIRTSPRNGPDFLAWFPERSGQFSVRSAYHLATEVQYAVGLGSSSGNPSGRRPIWQRIWSANVPLKMKIMAWKAASGALATNECKKFRHISIQDSCPICGREKDTSFHARVSCMHARAVWTQMRNIWRLPHHDLLRDTGKDWLLNVLANCDDMMRDCTIMLIWRIWNLRSDLRHGKESSPLATTAEFFAELYELAEYLQALFHRRSYQGQDAHASGSGHGGSCTVHYLAVAEAAAWPSGSVCGRSVHACGWHGGGGYDTATT